MASAKTCFVVMGYGKKTDFETGRTLDLDKSYRTMIKPAVEDCGLACVRSDEIRHSGVIDVVMFQQLLEADLVVADLSTSNPNAFYELGVRHALRPYATILIAENKLRYPFDVSHVAISRYEHMGDGIDFEEVMRFRSQLKAAIQAILANPKKDSPVYANLPGLAPPSMAEVAKAVAAAVASAPAPAGEAEGVLVSRANELIAKDQFAEAKALLESVRIMKPKDGPRTLNDDYVIQRLAFATYKSKLPTPQAALESAAKLLEELHPAGSNDTETLGLHGAVQKRLWGVTHDRANLDQAIRSYERGFYLRGDYYNGINLAFLLNVRASLSEPPDAIADFVLANRIRREVVRICTALVEGRDPGTGEPANRETSDLERRYWVRATLAEAWLGLGETAKSEQWLAEANALQQQSASGAAAVSGWMRDSTNEQLARLGQLLQATPLGHIKP